MRSRLPASFRGDIEGLRAVAVGLVLLHHAGLSQVPGGYIGVDVFFVISGFLITKLIVREAESTGTVSLRRFYARRMRRLLPAAAVVLVAVVVLATLLMPPLDRRTAAIDVVAAALYVINWQQASRAVDYFATDAPSPLQHFWSLAVEEQFYIVWPLLLIAVLLWCSRRGGLPLRPRLGAVFSVLAIVSFGYAVQLSNAEPGLAYFSTLTRGWELAVGGLLALVPTAWWRQLPAQLPRVLAGAGIATVALGAVYLTDESAFPGPWGLLPVLGTAAVIAAGCCSSDTAVSRFLSTRPMRYVGRISYSWYLWHWPAVIFAPLAFGALTTAKIAVVVALSGVPAALTHTLVENRMRKASTFLPTRRALALGAACSALTVSAATTSWVSTPTVDLASTDQAKGALVLSAPDQPQKDAAALRPLPEEAENDRGDAHDGDCIATQAIRAVKECEFGDTASNETAVLFGDSHAMHYAPALDKIAERRGMKLVTITKMACSPAEATTYNARLNRQYNECDDWRARALDRIEEIRPDLIITGNNETQTVIESGEKLDSDESAEAMESGLAKTLRALRDTGATVVAMADNPHPPQNIPSCVSAEFDSLEDCAFTDEQGATPAPVNKLAAARVEGTKVVDPKPALCKDGICPAVVGNVIVYRTGAHITATYMETLTDWLDKRIPQVT